MPTPRVVLRALIAGYLLLAAVGGIVLLSSSGRMEAYSDAGRARRPPASASPSSSPAPELGVVRQLTGQVALYPRAIRLAHSGAANGRIIASVVSHNGGGGTGEIFESDDDGATFRHIGTIADELAAQGRGLCCGSLFEVPQATGGTPAGTLLWAASVGQNARDRRMALRVWQSRDQGRTWAYLSNCATAPNTGGLWEPELSADAAGRLVCHYSDETRPGHGQVLTRVRSPDGGRTWAERRDTVVPADPGDRAGMAVVRRSPSGLYAMAYEVCASRNTPRCPIHLRTSTDGWNWTGPDIRPQTAGHTGYEHAPSVAWVPDAEGGHLVLTGQLLTRRDGTAVPSAGRVLLTDHQGGHVWGQVTAPITTPTPTPRGDSCSNYSSALLPSTDGHRVLEISTHVDRGGVCRAYYATARL